LTACASDPKNATPLISYKDAQKRCRDGERKSWEDMPTCADRLSYTVAKDQCKAGKKNPNGGLTDCARRLSGKGK
jgi:hypothetical protein